MDTQQQANVQNEQNDSVYETKTDNINQPSDGKKNTDNKMNDQKEIMIPKSRFDEVNNKYKELKAKLEEIEAANKKKEEEVAQQRGEFENLYNQAKSELETVKKERKAAQERVEVLEGVINQLLEAKLEEIDKEYHDLIPDSLTPEQKLAWVTSAQKKGLFKNTEANTPLGERTNPKDGGGEVETKNMSPFQLLLSGYSKKK